MLLKTRNSTSALTIGVSEDGGATVLSTVCVTSSTRKDTKSSSRRSISV